jgi:hypothetical protein
MLHRQRTEFWETAPQYDGLTETWNTLRVAVELSHQNDLITAQAVLDSAGITIPTGDLGQGCYDEQGHRFVLPDFVLAEPSNIMDDDIEAKPRDSSSTAIMKHEIEDIEPADDIEVKYRVFNHLFISHGRSKSECHRQHEMLMWNSQAATMWSTSRSV